MQHQAEKHGFTLIEILLVIAIIGVMAIFSMRFFGAYSENTKVHEATTQIQRILQATLSYYSDQKQWPQSLEQSGFLNDYLVTKDLITPWGQKYIGYPTSTYQFRIEAPMQKIRGQKIAALLPSVSYDTTSQRLIAQIVTVPQAEKGAIKIAGMGQNVTNGSQVSAVCNNNETAKFYFTPNSINTEEYHGPRKPGRKNISFVYAWPISRLSAQANCDTPAINVPKPGKSTTTCKVNIQIMHGNTAFGGRGDPSNTPNGTATMNYIAVCRGVDS